jgi:hypothetical protein
MPNGIFFCQVGTKKIYLYEIEYTRAFINHLFLPLIYSTICTRYNTISKTKSAKNKLFYFWPKTFHTLILHITIIEIILRISSYSPKIIFLSN